MGRQISWGEVQGHDKEKDVWIIVNGQVFDMTGFAPEHPGGAEIIYQHAGKDASEAYNEVHSPNLIRKHLEESCHVGTFDASTLPAKTSTSQVDNPASAVKAIASNTTQSTLQPGSGNGKPFLDEIINLEDFRRAAQQSFSPKAWAYIAGASYDNYTRDANQEMLRRIWLRPAVMRDVSVVDTTTTLFGCRLSMPVYISPTGAVKMAGPEGELAQAKGAAATGIIQCFSTPASYPHEEILEVTPERAFFQLYVNKDRAKSEEMIRTVTAAGKVKAIFVTVDCPVISKREDDERVASNAAAATATATARAGRDKKGAGLTRQASSFIDSTLSWKDVEWLRRITDLPIVVKGLQRWEDAVIALRHGCDGIVISNHGGRAADTTQPSILTLLELRRNCPQVFDRMKVLVDGGFRRGSDVLKAICLGASAVGIGRPFMFAVNYGQEGVEHLVTLLHDELKTTMQLCGMTQLMREASPNYINTRDIDHLVPGMQTPLQGVAEGAKSKL
ncbi:hypothetical protein NLU13_7984 [Sarocladium strictum]|uniref:L-lactate dehydrogenase (cytochrome) n=1 Tax=Sarocladium strictum TaxID=5046 RepID=A0AA39GD29_SARSR|nr:hypothetical protein NLU13_7984 [Sarocladium strictum]